MATSDNTHGFLRLTGASSRQLLDDVTTPGLAAGAAASLSPSQLTARLWNDLQGTWSGRLGFNLIALPGPGSTPSELGDFTLLLNPYSELLTFRDPGAPARNRGGDVDQFVAALEYEQRVTDSANDQLLHVETGMFLNLSNIVRNGTTTPEPIPALNIARSGTIPHGDSVMLLGAPPTVAAGPPTIPDISSLPTNLGSPAPLGYTDPYLEPPAGTPADRNVTNPNATLRDALTAQEGAGFTVLETTTFAFDSAPSGSVANVPYVVERANATRMLATFWFEKVHNAATGQEFDQLQYSQVIDLAFHHNAAPPTDENVITWPHVTVNTLVKQ
jgi:hypothetical protein